MKTFSMVVASGLALALMGCGKDDPNKNLKPIDASTPPPKIAKEGQGGAAPLDKPAGVIKG